MILEKSVELRKAAQDLDSSSYMQKKLITNKVTTHFFITLNKPITRLKRLLLVHIFYALNWFFQVELCPLELAIYLRINFTNQIEGSYLTVASENLQDWREFPNGFYLRSYDDALWLRGYWADTDVIWSTNSEFDSHWEKGKAKKPRVNRGFFACHQIKNMMR